MIKQSIIVALTLFIGYNAYLFLSSEPTKYYPQNITQDNVIKVQEYQYANRLPQKVIVGSSLAAKLNINLLDSSFYNLAFRGESIYDGFEIILSRKKLPSQIFIEYNIFLKSPQKNDIDKRSLKYKLANFIKEYLPSQREKNQPVNRAILFAYNVLESFKPIKNNTSSKKNDPVQTDEVSLNSSMENIVGKEFDTYSQIPPDSVVDEKIGLMKKYIAQFESRGVEITFFEMPVDPRICDTKLFKFVGNTIHKNFPPNKYNYIEPDDCSKYKTKDGLHLIDESADRFTKYLEANISE